MQHWLTPASLVWGSSKSLNLPKAEVMLIAALMNCDMPAIQVHQLI
jgi:hypothetical protein